MKHYTTKALHTPRIKKDPFGALNMPIYDSVAFEFESAEDIADTFQGKKTAHTYSRSSNPSVEYLEAKIKYITDAHNVLAVASGMAAISNTLIALTNPGDNIISTTHLFGHTVSLLETTLPSFGRETKFANLLNYKEVEQLIDEKTRIIFFETITNPHLEISDIKKLAEIAHKKNVLLICDSTVTPPYVFHSKSLGIDVEVMSSTKFMSGGATAVGGMIIDNGIADWSKVSSLKPFFEKVGQNAFIAKLRKEIYRNLGGCMTAHNAYMISLGLDSLALRLDKSTENATKIAQYLEEHPQIRQVNYPGLKSSPFYSTAMSQFSGKGGAILTFDLSSEKECFSFLNNLKCIKRATNLNDNKSLIIHPYSTIYCDFSPQIRSEMGIRDTMIRFSVGIEGFDDLVDDIEQALKNA